MFEREKSNNNVIKYKIEKFEEVDELSLQMQLLNKIPGVIQIGRAGDEFLLAVSNLIPLSEYLKDKDDTVIDTLISEYRQIVNSVENFMIPSTMVILNFEFAFVLDDELCLPCVPTNWSHLESRTEEEFLALVSLYIKPSAEKPPKKEKTKKEQKPKKPRKRLLRHLKENLFSDDGEDFFELEEENLPSGVTVIAVRSTGEEYPLLLGPDIIGTDQSSCSICFVGNEEISPKHCSITFSKGHYFLADLNSNAGTFLNGKRLEPGKTYELFSADLISIADEQLVFSKRNI